MCVFVSKGECVCVWVLGGGGSYMYGTFSAALHVLMFCVCPCRSIIIYMLSNVCVCERGRVCVLGGGELCVWNFQCCFACFVCVHVDL